MLRDEEGLFTAVQIVVLMFFAAMAVFFLHVVRIIDGKANLQNAADSSARAAATVLARNLNLISATNHLIGESVAMLAVYDAINGPPSGQSRGDGRYEDRVQLESPESEENFPSYWSEEESTSCWSEEESIEELKEAQDKLEEAQEQLKRAIETPPPSSDARYTEWAAALKKPLWNQYIFERLCEKTDYQAMVRKALILLRLRLARLYKDRAKFLSLSTDGTPDKPSFDSINGGDQPVEKSIEHEYDVLVDLAYHVSKSEPRFSETTKAIQEKTLGLKYEQFLRQPASKEYNYSSRKYAEIVFDNSEDLAKEIAESVGQANLRQGYLSVQLARRSGSAGNVASELARQGELRRK